MGDINKLDKADTDELLLKAKAKSKKRFADLDPEYYEGADNLFQPRKTKIRKKIILGMDTEDDQKGNMLYTVQYDGKEFSIFTEQYHYVLFLRRLSNKYGRRNIYIACVNLEYDIINAFRGYYQFLEFNYGAGLIYCKLKDTRIYFLDTLNHYKMGVKKQGKIIGLEKGVVDYKQLKRDKKTLEYCKRDTEITYRFVNYYQKALNDIGCAMRFTIASSAMDLFARQFLKFGMYRIKDKYLDKMRLAYAGGRTEIFKTKAQGQIQYMDVNSLYPYVMKKFNYPDINSMFAGKSIDYEGVSEATIEYVSKDIHVPYLPVKFAHKLLFPLGKLRGWWSNYELRYGVEQGLFKILKLHESVLFRHTVDLFSEYVDYLYTMRKKYKEIKTTEGAFYDISLKLLMNSLYGKFGEQVSSQDVIFDNEGMIKEIVEKEKYYPSHTNYIVSLYVTAYARTVLFEGLTKVAKEGGDLLYCDTDSIQYVGKPDILECSLELGAFKSEGLFKSAEYFQPKNYVLYDKDGKPKVACKGVPQDQSMQYIEKHMAKMWRPIRLRESFRRSDKTLIANLWVEKEKALKSQYDKRIVLEDGSTKPLIFPDDMVRFKGVKIQELGD